MRKSGDEDRLERRRRVGQKNITAFAVVTVAAISLGGSCAITNDDDGESGQLPVAGVQISPGSALLMPGATQSFTAIAVDRLGRSMEVQFIWNATGGSVTGEGLYTAGVVAGSFAVTVAEQATAISDSARIEVVAPGEPSR